MSYSKDQATAQAPASLTKIVTALVLRLHVPDGDLDDTVTVVSGDLLPGSTAGLMNGDVISYRDLAYGMLLPSGNDAAHCIARNVGAIISGVGDPVDNFITAMNTLATSLNMTTAVFGNPTGIDGDGNAMSPNDVYKAFTELIADAFLLTVAGTLNRTITITGANARTYGVTNTVDPGGTYPFPEYIASKTGLTPSAGYCMVMLYDLPDTTRRISVVMNTTTEANLFGDMRRLVNYEIALTA